MKIESQITTFVLASLNAVSRAAAGAGRFLHPGKTDHMERGDVPGWVMITLMSAVLVAGLLAIAGPALETMFTEAMGRVGQ